MTTIDEALNAMTKPELVRLVKRIKSRTFYLMTKDDVLYVQWEEASQQATDAMKAYIAMGDPVSKATAESIRATDAMLAAMKAGKSTAKLLRAMDAAEAARDKLAAEKDRLWAAYERHNKRADRLWQELESER